MSNVIRSLIVRVGADTSEFATSMKNVSKDLGGIGKNISRTGRDLSRAGATLTKSVTLPIVGIGVASGKAAIDFESAFAGVKKTVDASVEDFAMLEQGIRDMAKEIPASAVEIAGVAEAAGQLGIEVPNIMGFTRAMIDLGEATNLSATDAATQLARFANITQMPQGDFGKLGSVIVSLGNNLATTESEIVDMGLRLAGAGKQVEMTEAEILSFAGALSSVGIESQAGGSAFSKVMVNMQLATETQSKSLQGFAKVAGMTGQEFTKAFKGDAAGALTKFIIGLGKSEEQGVSAIKVLDDMGITEVRMRDTLLRAAGAGDLFANSVKLGTEAWAENTALTKEAEQRYGTTASQIEVAKNRMTDVGITIGEALAPHLITFADKLEDVTEWFGNLDPETQEAIIKMAGLAAAIGPVLSVAGSLTGVLGSMFGTVSKVTKGVGIFSKAIGAGEGIIGALGAALGPGAAVMLGLAALAGAAYLIYKNWDKITAAVSKAIDKIKEYVKVDDSTQDAMDLWGTYGWKKTAPAPVAVNPNSVQGGQQRTRWNASGAIFTRPTVLPTIAGWQGFGEAGPEAVLPLSKLGSLVGDLKQTINHTGTIRVEGVNNQGQLVATTDLVMDQLRRELRR